MQFRHSVCCFSSGSDPQHKLVLLEVTNRCNFRCSYCHVDFDLHQDSLLGERRLAEVLEELSALRFSALILSGGEPLLYPHLEAVLQRATALGFGVDLCTNGMLLTESRVTWLRKYLSRITVTLDTFAEETFDRMKGVRHAFRKCIAGLERLLASGFAVNVTIVPTALNAHQLAHTVQYLYTLGVKSIAVLKLYEGAKSRAVAPGQGSGPELERRILSAIDPFDDQALRISAKGFFLQGPDIGECRAGESVFGIDAKGFLLPCILLRQERPEWDLKRRRVSEALESMAAFVAEKRRLACPGCEHDASCRKGCLGSGYIQSGTLEPDVRCPLPGGEELLS
ncbi:MAG TPA: radical SAM protein [Anaerolineae bacterium]|nr:radical SAM protein [Anaerolineae bacterium]